MYLNEFSRVSFPCVLAIELICAIRAKVLPEITDEKQPKLDLQIGTETKKTYSKPSEHLFPQRWSFSYPNFTKYMTTHIKGANGTKIFIIYVILVYLNRHLFLLNASEMSRSVNSYKAYSLG